MTTKRIAMDGMTAAAYAAYALSDMAVIYPITPASHMAETIEAWSVAGRKNLFGQTVTVKEMQSEKGVAGAMHGALAGGALTSTFTASQGLMLMIPNMYKIAGELLPGVFHITSRSLAAHALSIFGDHQDIMAVRATGVAMLASTSVQECMDLSLVAHLSAIDGSLPIAHFFDGFRTSDEIETIDVIDPEDMMKMVDMDKVYRFRSAAMEPEHPVIRGTAQNPDVYFQNREAPNVIYDDFIQTVKDNMDKVARVTGRQYHLFDYYGAPDADRVVVSLCSSCDVIEEVVNYLNNNGEKVGLVKVRLYRPFSALDFVRSIPESAKVICALDRTKEPGSQGEPLLQDVCTALMTFGRTVRVIGGRYGLSSKDFTPAMVRAVFDNMRSPRMLPRFTVGIKDDVSRMSLAVGPALNTIAPDTYQCIFYGFGSDGTVGANKQATKIIGNNSDLFAQGYFSFDSKKSGGLTTSYLRFGKSPIHSPYLIEQADYVACHKSIYVKRGYDMADHLKEGGIFVLNSEWTTLEELEKELPDYVKREIAGKKAVFYNIDASALAAKIGLGHRINMIMQTVFFKLSGIIPFETAMNALKQDIQTMYASKGRNVIEMNLQAISQTLPELKRIDYPESWVNAVDKPTPAEKAPTFIIKVFNPIEKLKGDELPVSAFNPAGFVPSGTAAFEKRTVAFEIPQWDDKKCVQCGECSFVCPHAAIRPYIAEPQELEGAPDAFVTIPAHAKELKGLQWRIQVYPQDCVGCGSCSNNCPAGALPMQPLQSQLETQKVNLAFAQKNISIKDNLMKPDNVVGTQLQQPLLEFSGACAGCGETPYVKLLTQLFGPRMIIANATGCSSIWGGYMPSIPYTTNKAGRGPAWGNSLFEDNGEYGYGIAKGVRIRRAQLESKVMAMTADKNTDEKLQQLLNKWLTMKTDGEASFDAGKAIVDRLQSLPSDENTEFLKKNSTMFGKKSVWAVGGDGWAYDIGFGGLDEVLASGENINVLVLDTEGYSNTGGEMSKATQLGSVSGFSADGKKTPKKNLGRMFMQYGYVYVASVCLGADMQQCITAMREAEAYDGPSIVIALCPCISWGIKSGMSTVIKESRKAVEAGYWPLYRFNPQLLKAGQEPLIIDYKAPDGTMSSFLNNQNRFASLAARKPELSARLQSELAKEAERFFSELEKTTDVYKTN